MMTNQQLVFLFELLMKREELGLFQSLSEDPNDQVTRNAYVDFLLDMGRDESAKLVREGFTPGASIQSSTFSTGVFTGYFQGFGPLQSGNVFAGTSWVHELQSQNIFQSGYGQELGSGDFGSPQYSGLKGGGCCS